MADKICLITLSDNYDHQTAVYSLYRELADRCEVYTVGISNPKSDAPNTCNNLYCDCPKRPGITKGTFNLVELRRLCKRIAALNCDTLYFESVHVWNILLAWRFRGKAKIVNTIHDVVPHDGSRAVLAVQKILCKLSDLIVIKSSGMRETALRVYSIPSEKLLVLPLWHRFPNFNSPANTKTVLMFGRVKKYKGIHFMSEICTKCSEINFIIAGAVDDDCADTVESLKSLGNVSVVDEQISPSAMENLFCNADWVVLPYESASQSGVVVDSYERSRPVIAFDTGSLSEQIVNGETGFIVPAANTSDFADAVKSAVAMNNDCHAEFCKNAYEYGFRKFSSQAIADFFIKMFVDGEVWK